MDFRDFRYVREDPFFLHNMLLRQSDQIQIEERDAALIPQHFQQSFAPSLPFEVLRKRLHRKKYNGQTCFG